MPQSKASGDTSEVIIGLPALSYDLVDLLDRQFPERTPDPSWTHQQILIEIGKREVVRWLLALRDEQPTVLTQKA